MKYVTVSDRQLLLEAETEEDHKTLAALDKISQDGRCSFTVSGSKVAPSAMLNQVTTLYLIVSRAT